MEVGTALREKGGADVLILGCACMGRYRTEIETRLSLPVVGAVQAAVMRTTGLVRLGYRRAV